MFWKQCRVVPFAVALGVCVMILFNQLSIGQVQRERTVNVTCAPVLLALPVTGFFHIAALTSRWSDIVAEQVDAMRASGQTWQRTDAIYVTFLGDNRGEARLADLVGWSNVSRPHWAIDEHLALQHEIVPLGPFGRLAGLMTNRHRDASSGNKFVPWMRSGELKLAEHPTLNAVYTYCRLHPTHLVWYAHSKGQRNELCWDSTPRNCSDHWRRFMTHFVVTNGWSNCGIPLSTDQADTCGVNWNDAAPRHYQGNFWWSTCAFINGNELPMAAVNVSQPIENHRMSAETWLWSARGARPTFGTHGRSSGRPLCLHHASSTDNCTNHNLYMTPYLPIDYETAPLGKCCKVTLQ